ncbi:hypothetical protein RCL1_001533 [Eukaryota sp. TZLM3-RCL]
MWTPFPHQISNPFESQFFSSSVFCFLLFSSLKAMTNTKVDLNSLLCSICCAIFRDPEIVSECGHSFCEECLHEWLNVSQICPTCRSHVDPNSIKANYTLREIIEELSQEDNQKHVTSKELSDVQFLAQGGHSTVFNAHFKGNPVVWKKLLQLSTAERLLTSIKHQLHIYSSLQSADKLVKIIAITTDEPGLIYERLDCSIQHLFNKKHVFSAQEQLLIIDSLLSALSSLHQCQIAHRDVSAGNVLLKMSNGHVVGAKLGDLDFAHDVNVPLSQGSVFRGTYAYMATEILLKTRHIADPRSDIFSLGVLLYGLLTGVDPGTGDQQRILTTRVQTDGKALLDLNLCPPEIHVLISSMVDPQPENRPTLIDIHLQLQSFLTSSVSDNDVIIQLRRENNDLQLRVQELLATNKTLEKCLLEAQKHLGGINSNYRPHHVEQLACGFAHCLALKSNGDLYSWGDNECGQCCPNLSTLVVSSPCPVKVDLTSHDKVKQVFCGLNSSFVVTEDGFLYGWGDLVGLVTGEDDPHVPTRLSLMNVTFASSTTDTLFFLLQDETLRMFSTFCDYITPLKNVVSISCSKTEDVAIILARDCVYLYSCGIVNKLPNLPLFGSLRSLHYYNDNLVATDTTGSIFSTKFVCSPTQSPSFSPISGLPRVETISCGCNFAVAMTSSGTIYGFGDLAWFSSTITRSFKLSEVSGCSQIISTADCIFYVKDGSVFGVGKSGSIELAGQSSSSTFIPITFPSLS